MLIYITALLMLCASLPLIAFGQHGGRSKQNKDTIIPIPEILVPSLPTAQERWMKREDAFFEAGIGHIVAKAINGSIEGAKEIAENNPSISGFFYVTRDFTLREMIGSDDSFIYNHAAQFTKGDIIFFTGNPAFFFYDIRGRGWVDAYIKNEIVPIATVSSTN